MVEEATAGTAAATQEGPAADEARAWVGHQVDDLTGDAVGKVDGVLVDAESGRPEWLVVRAGRFGHRALAPARHAVGAVGRVWVPYARDAIRAAPRVDARGLTRDAEEQLLAHYGVSADAGRAGEIAGREAAAVTATPIA